MDDNSWKVKIGTFWQKYEPKIVLILGFILIAGLSFEAGILRGQKNSENPIIIEKPVQNQNSAEQTLLDPSGAQNLAQDTKKVDTRSNIPTQNCAFMGSKNSNKYHLPSCRWAKNIKPENLVCFKDVNEAAARGYLPDKNCIK